MDWARAIERNREALIGIVAALFSMLELTGAATAALIPRALHRAVLRVLRPAESAVRRLVVIAARGIEVKLRPSRAMPVGPIKRGGGHATFQLFDPRKRVTLPHQRSSVRIMPRIHFFANDPRVAALWPAPRPTGNPVPLPESRIEAKRLCRRLHAIKRALDDLPRQARRLVRWRARRERTQRPAFTSPLRPGHPPGYRRKPVHDVDEVLVECHGLARDAMQPDTS